MNSLKLTPVPQGTRWPSGDSVDIAVLPITADDLSSRIGLPLVQDIEDGLGAWSGTGGRLPSGREVEFVCYATRPRQVIVRVDKGAPYSAVLDEALQLVGLSRTEVRVNPLADG
jgi:hypothetical protein